MAGESAGSSGPIERAFILLQAVIAAGGPVGVRELGRRTGLPRSTTSRLVTTLAELGMVERTAEGMVVPGTALATLAVDGGLAPLLRDRLRPLMTALGNEHGESVALAVDDGDAVLYVAQIDALSAVRAPDVQSERHPIHVVAHGLVLMANWPADRLDRYLHGPLVATTARSQTDPDRLRSRLARICVDGFAWTEEEFADEVNGLAVPVVEAGTVVASIGLYGPSYRLSPEAQPDLGPSLAVTVDKWLTGSQTRGVSSEAARRRSPDRVNVRGGEGTVTWRS